jgi:Holliday junction resolvase RusA-like endonuclease
MDLGNIEKATSDLLQSMRLIQNDLMAESITIEWGDVEGGMMNVEVEEA